MTIALGEIIQVTYQMAMAGQLVENVIHYREIPLVTTPAQRADAAEKYWTAIAPMVSVHVSFTQMIIKQLTPIVFDEQIVAPVSTGSGTLSEDAVNNTVALILTKRTGVAGKDHRGRLYIAGIGIGMNSGDENRLNGFGVGLANTAKAAILTALGPTGTDTHLQFGLYSRLLGGTHPYTVSGWQQVTALDLQVILGNQRRRRVGVGA